MQLALKPSNPISMPCDCLIVLIFDEKKNGAIVNQINEASDKLIKAVTKNKDFKPDLGTTLMLYQPSGITAKRLLLVGLGKRASLSYKKLATAINKATELAAKVARTVAIDCTELDAPQLEEAAALRLIVQQLVGATYTFDAQKSKAKKLFTTKKVLICAPSGLKPKEARQQLTTGQATAEGIALTRDLGNQPPNVCTPIYLAAKAKSIAKQNNKMKVTVYAEKQIRDMGMGAFTAVGQGSVNPPRLICFEYKGGKATQAPIAFVGKGVTFDTGGISIKPASNMAEMKYDMCGAAAVMGLMHILAMLDLPLNVIGAVGAAENMPGSKASRPGDIVKTYAGKTVEILNTDAEGRLVLCDVLAWVNKKFAPKQIIDLATLTGACLVALGNFTTGVLGNNQAMIDAILQASEFSGERSWQLPMFEEFSDQLKSPHADLANIGGRYGGTITAAKYLENFVGDTPWVHLDIAPSAWKSGDNRSATGRPVAMLSTYLQSLSA